IESIGIRPISCPGCLFWAADTYPRPRSTVSSISSLPLPLRVAMCMSGLCTSTPAGGAMSVAVTSPGPCLRRYMTTGSSCSEETTSSLRFRMMSVTSSLTPATVENSCSTPSIRMLVTAAPGMDDSRVRRRELPIVYPNPGSSGSMTNLDRKSSTGSSVRVGRWAMSISYPFPRRPLFDAATFSYFLLRVQLDDELFLHLRVDLGPGRQGVDEDPHLVGDDLEPRRDRPLARLGPGDHERGHLQRCRPDLDDVALGHPVGGNVHLLAVDQEVPVPHQLARHVTALGEAGPVDHVVEAALQDLEQVLAGLAALARRFLVVVVELPLQDPVYPAGLLLLPDLEQVLALLRPVAAVLTGWVGPDLYGALGRVALGALQVQLHLLAAAELAVRTGVSSHLSVLLRPGAASAGGSRCAERA